MLRRVGGGELLDITDPKAVLPKLLPGVLAALGAPTNDAATERNHRRTDEELKRRKSLILVGQQIDGGPLDVLVVYLADVLRAAYGYWRKGPQLERPVDLVVGSLGVSKLLSFPHSPNVAVRDSPLECDTSAVSLA